MKSKVLTGLAALFLLFAAAGHAGAAEVVFAGSIIQESYDANDTTSDTISVDYWSFTVNTPGTVTIDVLSWESNPNDWTWVDVNGDGEESFIDSYIHVFKGPLDAATLYASNDDGGSAGFGDGTIRGNDSYLSRVFETGDYIIAISSCGYPSDYFSVGEALAGLNQKAIIPYTTGEGDHGDYRITVSGDVSSVPVPAAVWLLGSGIAGMAALKRRIISA